MSAAAKAEIVIAGEPQSATLAALAAAGEKITDAQIVEAFLSVESKRGDYMIAALAAGVRLFAKKAATKHGQWLPYCDQLAKSAKLKGAGMAAVSSARSLRRLTFLAQHFIADLEQGAFVPAERDAAVPTLPGVKTEDVLTLETLPAARREIVIAKMTKFIAGRSLAGMLHDLRRADDAAESEEAEQARSPGLGGGGSGGGGQGEFDLWQDVERPLEQITALMSDLIFIERTDAKFWKRTAKALSEAAALAEEKAREIKA